RVSLTLTATVSEGARIAESTTTATAPAATACETNACPSACSPCKAANSAPGLTRRESLSIALIARETSPRTAVPGGRRAISALRSTVSAMRSSRRQDSGVQHRRTRNLRKRRGCDHASVVGSDGTLDFHVDEIARVLVRDHADEGRGVVSGAICTVDDHLRGSRFPGSRVSGNLRGGVACAVQDDHAQEAAQLSGSAPREDAPYDVRRDTANEFALLIVNGAHDVRLHQETAVGDGAIVARHGDRRDGNALSERHRCERWCAPIARGRNDARILTGQLDAGRIAESRPALHRVERFRSDRHSDFGGSDVVRKFDDLSQGLAAAGPGHEAVFRVVNDSPAHLQAIVRGEARRQRYLMRLERGGSREEFVR